MLVHVQSDTSSIIHIVAPLVLDCSLNAEMKVECRSNNQLAPDHTVCTFNGEAEDPCNNNKYKTVVLLHYIQLAVL